MDEGTRRARVNAAFEGVLREPLGREVPHDQRRLPRVHINGFFEVPVVGLRRKPRPNSDMLWQLSADKVLEISTRKPWKKSRARTANCVGVASPQRALRVSSGS